AWWHPPAGRSPCRARPRPFADRRRGQPRPSRQSSPGSDRPRNRGRHTRTDGHPASARARRRDRPAARCCTASGAPPAHSPVGSDGGPEPCPCRRSRASPSPARRSRVENHSVPSRTCGNPLVVLLPERGPGAQGYTSRAREGGRRFDCRVVAQVFAQPRKLCSDAHMRAALRILCVQCVLFAGTTLAAGFVPHDPATAHPPSPSVPSATPAAALPAEPEVAPTPAEAGLPSAPGAPAAAALPPQDLLFACPTTLDHLGRVVAAVMVDGKGPFRFVVDTGANHSIISPQLAALLGLTPSLAPAIRVTGITGSAQVASVPIEMLRAGDLEISNTRFPVIWSSVMAGAAGILGAAGLSEDRLIVDFEHNQVQITRSHGEALPWGFTRLWATRLNGGLLSVPGHVGSVPVQAIIDTGSQHTLGNLALYRELFEREQGKGDYINTDVYGATQQVG